MDRRSLLSLFGIGAAVSVAGIKTARPAPVAPPAATGPIVGEMRQVFSHWAPSTTTVNSPAHTHTLSIAELPSHHHNSIGACGPLHSSGGYPAYPHFKTVIWNGTDWVDGLGF